MLHRGPDGPVRPRIGLVLGGGGAKGAAHIGVLQVLDELRVPVDCIAGTSMGALVGAVYAVGERPDDIEAAVRDIDWQRTIGGKGRREELPIERKLTRVNYSNPLEFGIGRDGLSIPGGVVNAQRIEDEIRLLVDSAQFVREFDDLKIPFRAVATDIVAGEMVVLDSGTLSTAMRASMALPGIFEPVRVGDKVLSDGGVTRNLPVDVGRELCADVVIAVWFESPPPSGEDITSALSVLTRAMDVMVQANEKLQIATLTDNDIAINVPVGDLGTGDFLRLGEAIDLGRQAAEGHRESLLSLSLPEQQYIAWRSGVDKTQPRSERVAGVDIVGLERVNVDYLRSRIAGLYGETAMMTADVESAIERIYATGDFSHVGYELTGPAGARRLEIRPIEKPWGPNFLRFDFGLSTTGDTDLHAVFRADHDLTWVNSRGGRWHNALQIGRQSELTTRFHQPLDVRQRFFVEPLASYAYELQDLYLGGDRVAVIGITDMLGQIDVGANFGSVAQLRVGLRRSRVETDFRTGSPSLPPIDSETDTTLRARFVYDSRDSVRLPTKGTLINLHYTRSEDWLGGERKYSLVEGIIAPAFSFREDAANVFIAGGQTISGELPITESIMVGGIRSFPGLRPGELRGDGYWYAGTSYFKRLAELQPLFGQAIYAGLRLQAGEILNPFEADIDGVLFGASVSLAGRTPVGAFLLSLGYVDSGSTRLQFTLGRPVAEGSILDELQ